MDSLQKLKIGTTRVKPSLFACMRTVASNVSIDRVYKQFAVDLKKVVPYQQLIVYLINGKTDALTSVFVAGLGIEHQGSESILQLEGSFLKQVVGSGQSLLVKDQREVEVDPGRTELPGVDAEGIVGMGRRHD